MAELYTRYRNAEAKANGRVSGYSAVFYDPDRRPKQKYVTLRTRDKQVARRRLRDMEKKESLGIFDPWQDRAPEYGLTLDEAVERFNAARAGAIAEKSASEERKALARFVATLHPAARLDAVRRQHVVGFVDAPKPDGSERAASTRRRYHAVLKGFFDWAVAQALIAQHPMEGTAPAKVHRKEARFLSTPEYERLLREIEGAAEDRDRPEAGGRDNEVGWIADAAAFQTATGLRAGELAALRWGSVHLDLRRIVVGQHEATKSGHERSVPLATPTVAIVERLAAAHPDRGAGDFVFRGAGGGRLNVEYYSKRIKAYAERAGLGSKVTSHTLRHTYGAMLASKGVSLYQIQKLMSHESMQTTNRYYGHLNPEALHDAVEGVFG